MSMNTNNQNQHSRSGGQGIETRTLTQTEGRGDVEGEGEDIVGEEEGSEGFDVLTRKKYEEQSKREREERRKRFSQGPAGGVGVGRRGIYEERRTSGSRFWKAMSFMTMS